MIPGGGDIATILVTAGPTHEHLDDVRYLANGSSGRMGYALAEAAHSRDHEVVLITGPTALAAPSGVDCRPVISACEMQTAVDRALASEPGAIDAIIMVAAVADYRPAERSAGKPKKSEGEWTLRLVPNPDILLGLGKRKNAGILDVVLVGFALESGTPDEILAKGQRKLDRKGLDLIVVNHVGAMGADENEVSLVFRDGRCLQPPRMAKSAVAHAILDALTELLGGEQPPADPPQDEQPQDGAS